MKTKETLDLEKSLFRFTNRLGTFGCFEVTIGWAGKERVDYMTYDTKGDFKCFEIKVSKKDFHSKHHNTFVGHLNYYVMPKELWEQVRNEIPEDVGVYVSMGNSLVSVKKAKRRKVSPEDIEILKNSFLRSVYRYAQKYFESEDELIIESHKRRIKQLEKEKLEYQNKYFKLVRKVYDKYGTFCGAD